MNPKYEEFINGTKNIMETTFIMEYLEDYEKEDIQQKINIYISQLQQYLKGYRSDLPNIIYEDRLFKQDWLELAFSLEFSAEEFGNLTKTCFGKYSPSFIIMNMDQKDVKYLECILENIPLRNNAEEAVYKFEETLRDLSERKNSNSEHGLDFNDDMVISALKVYLQRHEKYLSDPDMTILSGVKIDEHGEPTAVSLTKVVLSHLEHIIPERIHELRSYMPLLPQAHEDEDLFCVGNNAISEIKVNKGALINKYSQLLTNEHIDTVFTNLLQVLDDTKLSNLTSIIYNKQHPNNTKEVNLLFMFSTPEKLDDPLLVSFLHDIVDIYCENYSITTSLEEKEINTLKKAISNCWLDAKLPNKNMEKTTKIKI